MHHFCNMKSSTFFRLSFLALCLLAVIVPLGASARTLHAGLPSDQLWFSKDPFFTGDTITIFTLVFNSSNYRLAGTMTLRDGTTTLDAKPFVVDASGGSQIVTFPWLVTHGNHSFSAIITQDELSESSRVIADTFISATRTPTVVRFADDDKNNNGIGDSTEPPSPPLAASTIATNTSSSLPTSGEVRKEEKALLDKLPTPIVSTAVPILGAVEDFRVSEAIKALRNLSAIENTIGNNSSTSPKVSGWKKLGEGITSGEVAKSPFDHFKLFIALILHFFTANPYAFYILLAFVLYKVIRFVITLFF